MRELEDALHPGGQQFLHREFGRGVEIERALALARLDEARGERMEMRLEAGAPLQGGRVHFGEFPLGEEGPDRAERRAAHGEIRPFAREDFAPPPAGSTVRRHRAASLSGRGWRIESVGLGTGIVPATYAT